MIATMVPAANAERATWQDSSPWESGLFRLMSLWDMLRIHAIDLVVLLQTIDRVRAGVSRVHEMVLNDTRANDPRFWKEFVAGIWDSAEPLLIDAEGACERLELRESIAHIREVRHRYTQNLFSLPELVGWLGSTIHIIQTQLRDRVLMYVPNEQAKYFSENTPPFGDKVQDKFPKATADITDASFCLGVGRWTAAVFHLMCVVEVGIRRLAKWLNVPRNQVDGKVWQQILAAMSAAIKALPSGTPEEQAKRDRCSEAIAHLHAVKNAWRNPTMHSRRRYSQEEAEAIFNNVKTFMHYLAAWRS
jgi:hypothetical protein